MEYIAFDAHKHYTLRRWLGRTVGSSANSGSRMSGERCSSFWRNVSRALGRGGDDRQLVWIVDEIEAAGCLPKLVHARKAKLMMGAINKTDKLDVRGLNQLQRNGTLPTVWIPPGELRDQRDLPRTRMVLVRQRSVEDLLHITGRAPMEIGGRLGP
jgi:hypothetical protein